MPKPTRRRWPQRLTTLFILLVLGFAGLWYGPGRLPERGPDPLLLERGPDGELTEIDGPATGNHASVALNIGVHGTMTDWSCATSSSREPLMSLACRSLQIRSRDQRLLTDIVARKLCRELGSFAELREIAYYPAGSEAEDGGDAPDLMLWLETGHHADRTLLGWGPTEIEFSATLSSDALPQETRFRAVTRPLPRILVDLTAELELSRNMRGICLPGGAVDGLADDISAAITARVVPHLEDLLATHGLIPDLPAEFRPTFQPVLLDELPLRALSDLEQVASWRAPMLHNETWWRTILARSDLAVLEQLADDFRGEGFELEHPDDHHFIQAIRGRESLAITTAKVESSDSEATEVEVTVCYRRGLEPPHVGELIDSTIREDSPIELLTLFASRWNEEQKQRALSLLGDERMKPLPMLKRALLLEELGNREAAERTLRNAIWDVWGALDNPGSEGSIRHVADAIDFELGAWHDPEQVIPEEAGVTVLRRGHGPVLCDLQVDRPVRLLVHPDDANGPRLYVIGVEPDGDGGWAYPIRERQEGGSSYSRYQPESRPKWFMSGVTIDWPDEGPGQIRASFSD